MTKPHTTLSEAVRALELPRQLRQCHPDARYSAAQVNTLLASIAKLVEQHEAQEPKPTDLSKRLRDIAASWASFTFSPISQEDVLAAAAEIERYYGGMLNWKRTAEAQSTGKEAQEPVLKARQEGRMEALAVILHQDPENPFNDQVYTGQDHSGDYSTAWNEEALRKLLAIDDAAYNAFDKAEAQYWEYRYHAFECEIAAKERREQPTLAATQAGDAWQPIETAPKDGTKILLGRPDDEIHDMGEISTVGRWHEEDHDGPDNMGHDAGFMDDEFQEFSWGRSFGAESHMSTGFQPTHWMPLPPAPTTTRSE
jgi:hypothetical protein